MISFYNPEDQFPNPETPWAAEIASLHSEFTDKCIQQALIARFGKIPPIEEIEAHCVCVIGPDHTKHYVWVDELPKVGEKVDISDPLCIIAPPEYFKPEKPHQ